MTGRKSSVANVINSLKIGGAEILLARFAEDYSKRFNSAIDIITLYKCGQLGTHIVQGESSTFHLKCRRKYDISIPFRLLRKLRKGKYRIVHVHLFPASLYAAIISLFINKKVQLIFTEHNIFNRRRLFPWFKMVDRLIYSRFVRIICVSKTVKNELLRWIPHIRDKVIVINNGIPIPPLRKETSKKYDIIFVGRLTAAKGLDGLLHAVSELKSNLLLNCVAIVGEGPLLPMLKEKARQLGVENKVCFLGARNDVNTLLHQSRLFVLPSRWEGLPLSVLEAMAFGIPVIASNVGGIPEVITHGVNGLLVKPEAPKLLAEVIGKLLSNRKLARTLGHNARKHILTHYSIEKYTNSIRSIYNEIFPEA